MSNKGDIKLDVDAMFIKECKALALQFKCDDYKPMGERLERLVNIVESLQADLAARDEVIEAAKIFVNDSYRPEPKYDAMRFDDLVEALRRIEK